MLPFLKRKSGSAGLIVKTREPDQNDSSDSDDSYSLEACSQDLINAIHSSDPKKVSEALRAAFEVLESEPHEEGPHTFDAQNIKAAESQED